jgi:hypothetical protein
MFGYSWERLALEELQDTLEPRRHIVSREEFWRNTNNAWRDSGQSVRAFCAARRRNEAAFGLLTIPAVGGLDEDAPHGLGRGGEEVPAAVELLVAKKPQIGFADEGGAHRFP